MLGGRKFEDERYGTESVYAVDTCNLSSDNVYLVWVRHQIVHGNYRVRGKNTCSLLDR